MSGENQKYNAPGPYIPIGQGFVVVGGAGGGPIVFNNSQREFVAEDSESIFLKGAKNSNKTDTGKIPIIKLGMNYINGDGIGLHRQIGISFRAGNSFTYDRGYDSRIFDLGASDMYWKFPDDETKYIIAGVQEISDDLEVPLEIVLEQDGEISIEIDEWQAIDRDVFLLDKLTGKEYKVSNPKAENKINLLAGVHTDRFVLAFTGLNSLLNEEKVAKNEELLIYLDTKNQEIVVQKTNCDNTGIDKVEIYTILGQKVSRWANLKKDCKTRLKIGSLSAGFYIVKIETDKGSTTKKILIK